MDSSIKDVPGWGIQRPRLAEQKYELNAAGVKFEVSVMVELVHVVQSVIKDHTFNCDPVKNVK